jgi:hypothetical protein
MGEHVGYTTKTGFLILEFFFFCVLKFVTGGWPRVAVTLNRN